MSLRLRGDATPLDACHPALLDQRTMPAKRTICTAFALLLLAGAAGCANKSERFCRQAHAEVNQLQAAFSRVEKGGPTTQPMPLEPFLSRCSRLPPEAARCAVPSYYREHRAECARHRAQLDQLGSH